MKVVSFLLSAMVTIGLVVVLNIPLPIGGSKTPPLGSFLSPQHGLWQNAEHANVDYNSSVVLPGLEGKADVYFDERLVPHVYAESDKDAFYLQGYLHAKFRLWQMDFQTYAAGGRLSEIMGAKVSNTDFLQIDKFFRRLGMVYGAEQSLKVMEADTYTKMELDAYSAGINAYINSLQPYQYPLEYKLLNYKPEAWTNMKTALFLKYMSFDLAGAEWDFEMTNARQLFSAADFELLYPVFQDSLDPIVPKGTPFKSPGVRPTAPAADSLSIHSSKNYQAAAMKPDKDNGSNNWAVAGTKTKSGRPILCNDPHLGLNLPSLWYEMQITTPNFNSYGATFPGAPAVIIGFNDSCAWGFTNAMRDVRDYYEIQFRDTTMQEYMYNGSWVKTAFRNEVIKVNGEADVVEKIAMTVFGPVMYDRNFSNKSKDNKSYAVRWKAHDASNELITFTKLDKAKNYADYRDAISTYQTPGQNMLFATKTGDIAITQQGQFPAKWRRQGDFLMPGTDTSFMWQANIPADENPSMYNPARGFVSSANQLPVDSTYPYYLGGSYPPYRGLTINKRLSAMNAMTPQDMQQLQTSNYNIFAAMARPMMLHYLNEQQLSADEIAFINKVKTWNLESNINEEAPSIFKAWWDSLEVVVFRDEFNQTQLPLKWPDESTLLEALLRDSSFKFVDDITTSKKETITDALVKAFKLAYPSLKKASDQGTLAWGKYKDSGVRHLLKLPALSRLHLPVGGGEHIINATKQYHGPSWRMIVHLTDLVEAYGVYPGGQNGNPGSKYYDNFIDAWAAGKYFPLLFIRKEDVAKNNNIKWHMTFSKT
jgi:penicillin G amidase